MDGDERHKSLQLRQVATEGRRLAFFLLNRVGVWSGCRESFTNVELSTSGGDWSRFQSSGQSLNRWRNQEFRLSAMAAAGFVRCCLGALAKLLIRRMGWEFFWRVGGREGLSGDPSVRRVADQPIVCAPVPERVVLVHQLRW